MPKFSPYWLLSGAVISLILLAAAATAGIQEKDYLINSPVCGDFRKARIVKEPQKVSLKVWDSYLAYLDKLPQSARDSLPRGVTSLEVAGDEIWVAEQQDYFHLGQKKGEPDLVKLYWRDGQVQALTVEKSFTADPVTWRRFSKPAYKLVAIFTREFILRKLARQVPKDQAFRQLTPLDHLQEARKALLEGQPQDQDITKRTYGRLADARQHLEAIPRESEEYEAARGLLTEVARREEDARKQQEVRQKMAEKRRLRQREELAAQLDRDFLEKGMDVKIEMTGSDKTTLRLDCLLFSRPMVFVLIDKTDLLANLKKAGFQEVIFTNKAIKYSWELDLDNLVGL